MCPLNGLPFTSAHRIDCSYAQAVQSRMIPISKDFQNLKKSLHGTVDAGDAPASKTAVSSEIQNKRGNRDPQTTHGLNVDLVFRHCLDKGHPMSKCTRPF